MDLFKAVASLVLSVIVLSGCGNQSPISGKWSSIEPIGDSEVMMNATLKLTHRGDVVSGTISLTAVTEGAPEEIQGRFPLQELRYKHGDLSFIVPIYPEDSGNIVAFYLHLEEDKLVGQFTDEKHLDFSYVEFQKD